MLTPDQIELALSRPLPGLAAHAAMAPLPLRDRTRPPRQPARQGGVLVLLYPRNRQDDLCLVLTRRSERLGNHRGQISFPGGSVDPDDAGTAATAVREACEEIGVCQEALRLLGRLTPLYIPPSNFCIHPHVAYLPEQPDFRLQPDEVAELFEVPVGHFIGSRNVAQEERIILGEPRSIPYFDVCGHKVWGATAMVLAEFAAVVERGAEGNWYPVRSDQRT